MKILKRLLCGIGWCISFVAMVIGIFYLDAGLNEKDIREHTIRLAPSPANLVKICITPSAEATEFQMEDRTWYSENAVLIEYEEPLQSVVQFYLTRKSTVRDQEYTKCILVQAMVNIKQVIRGDMKVLQVSLAENPREEAQ